LGNIAHSHDNNLGYSDRQAALKALAELRDLRSQLAEHAETVELAHMGRCFAHIREDGRPAFGYEHPDCGFHWHGKDGTDVPTDDERQPVCPRCELDSLRSQLAESQRENAELIADLDAANLRCIEAGVQGVDMDAIRRLRSPFRNSINPITMMGPFDG
jgi:hypothetical protein